MAVRPPEPLPSAYWMTRILFFLFAEDIDLLPGRLFSTPMAMVKPRPAL